MGRNVVGAAENGVGDLVRIMETGAAVVGLTEGAMVGVIEGADVLGTALGLADGDLLGCLDTAAGESDGASVG